MIAFTTPKIAPTISSVTILRPRPASPSETTTPGTTAVATQMATALTTTLISREPTGRILPRTVATWGGATVRLDQIVLRVTARGSGVRRGGRVLGHRVRSGRSRGLGLLRLPGLQAGLGPQLLLGQEERHHEGDGEDGRPDREHQVHRVGEALQHGPGQAWVEPADERRV